jgi:hypothetical protein
MHTNAMESFFALFKRALFGQFRNISEAHPSAAVGPHAVTGCR